MSEPTKLVNLAKAGLPERQLQLAQQTASDISQSRLEGWRALSYSAPPHFVDPTDPFTPGDRTELSQNERMARGEWFRDVALVREQNRGRLQSLLVSAWLLTREQDERASILWDYCVREYGVPLDVSPQSHSDCRRIAKACVRFPWTMQARSAA